MNYGGRIYASSDRVAIRMTGENPVVFDGGAHVGDYVQDVLDARPRATIHAFEAAADIDRIVHDGAVRIGRYHERWEILWTANYLAVPRR
jgi:hypothetical protein